MLSINLGANAKLMALVVLGATACGFCYSIGVQTGRTESTDWFNSRLDGLNQQLRTVIPDDEPDQRGPLAAGNHEQEMEQGPE